MLQGAHVPTQQQALSLRLFSFLLAGSCWSPESVSLHPSPPPSSSTVPPPPVSTALPCSKRVYSDEHVREKKGQIGKGAIELFRLSKLINSRELVGTKGICGDDNGQERGV